MDDDANDVQTSLRLPTGLVERIDAHAARVREQTGITVKRAQAIRALIEAGLETVEAREPSPKRKR